MRAVEGSTVISSPETDCHCEMYPASLPLRPKAAVPSPVSQGLSLSTLLSLHSTPIYSSCYNRDRPRYPHTRGSLLYIDGDVGQNPPGVNTSNLINIYLALTLA